MDVVPKWNDFKDQSVICMFTTFKKYMLVWYRQAFLKLIFADSQSSLQDIRNIIDPSDNDTNLG